MTFKEEKILNACKKIKQDWMIESNCFPEFMKEISKTDQSKNEIWINSAADSIKKQLNSYPVLPVSRRKWKLKTEELVHSLLMEEPVLGISVSMPAPVIESFQNEMKRFLQSVRSFDPDLDMEEIGQALRNYLVYAVFNEVNGLEQACSPAIFGYSMLYPYTDNYIDDPAHTESEKKAYNTLIYKKLSRLPVSSETKEQAQAEKMLDSIITFYEEEQAQDICQGLLLMLEAQKRSLRQQSTASLSEQEILDISVYKGGLSVLIDRYFVQKEITEKDLDFYMGYGFFLQLADDLQDIAEDSNTLNQTLFTCRTDSEYLEKTVNRMLCYLKRLFDHYPGSDFAFQEFLLQSCCWLIFASLEKSSQYFSAAYLKKAEAYFPVSFSALKNWNSNHTFQSLDIKYKNLLDEMLEN